MDDESARNAAEAVSALRGAQTIRKILDERRSGRPGYIFPAVPNTPLQPDLSKGLDDLLLYMKKLDYEEAIRDTLETFPRAEYTSVYEVWADMQFLSKILEQDISDRLKTEVRDKMEILKTKAIEMSSKKSDEIKPAAENLPPKPEEVPELTVGGKVFKKGSCFTHTLLKGQGNTFVTKMRVLGVYSGYIEVEKTERTNNGVPAEINTKHSLLTNQTLLNSISEIEFVDCNASTEAPKLLTNDSCPHKTTIPEPTIQKIVDHIHTFVNSHGTFHFTETNFDSINRQVRSIIGGAESMDIVNPTQRGGSNDYDVFGSTCVGSHAITVRFNDKKKYTSSDFETMEGGGRGTAFVFLIAVPGKELKPYAKSTREKYIPRKARKTDMRN